MQLNPFHGQFASRIGKNADALRCAAAAQGIGNQASIDQGRLARSGLAIKKHAAVEGNKICQAIRLGVALEENPPVEKTERKNPAVRFFRQRQLAGIDFHSGIGRRKRRW